MILHEWEIWHTYSTYLDARIDDLESVGHTIVDAGIALCSMHRDGKTHWRSVMEVQSGWTTVKLDARGHTAGTELVPDDCETATFAPFALEAWNQSAHFRFSEIRLFGEERPLPPAYLRLFLGQCNLVSGEQSRLVRCYPVVKLYESGVILVELRIFAPDRAMETKEFINEYVNIHQEQFDRVEVPPALAKLAPRVYAHYMRRKWPLHLRADLLRLERGHDKAITERTTIYDEDDFSFELAPLSRDEKNDQKDTLSSFALTLVRAIAYVLSKPYKGIRFLLQGQKALTDIGDYWSGRPHIYLIRFEDQKDTASENEERHRGDLGWILSRTWGDNPAMGEGYLPPSSRAFDDFGAYITLAATLWVWAQLGIRNQEPWADPNRGHLIYEHQAAVEMIEYGYMLHRSLFERATSYSKPDEVLEARRDLTILKLQMGEASHFGETRDLLQRGWESMGVPELRERIAESLAIRESETALADSRVGERRERLLTILFGLIAVPPIATEVVEPLFNYLGMWRPNDVAAAKLFMILIAMVVTTLLIYTILGVASRGSDSHTS